MNNPKIDWLELHIKFHKVHSDAGWDPIPNEEIENRFVFYHQWLSQKELIDTQGQSIDKKFILYKDQITEKGWQFLPKVQDRFISLMSPDRSQEQDIKYLNKRYKKLVG